MPCPTVTPPPQKPTERRGPSAPLALHELYIYYRVSPAQAEAARREVQALHTELRGRYAGLVARCLRRAGTGAGESQTWMEIYTHAAGLSADDVAAILQRGATTVCSIDGPRHAEVFDPCA